MPDAHSPSYSARAPVDISEQVKALCAACGVDYDGCTQIVITPMQIEITCWAKDEHGVVRLDEKTGLPLQVVHHRHVRT